jgi:hypothetical protein
MKNNKTMLIAIFAMASLMGSCSFAMEGAQEQAKASTSGFKKYANLCFGAFFAGLGFDQYVKHDFCKKYSNLSYKEKRKNFLSSEMDILYSRKPYRQFAVASGLVSGLFFYNALSGFTGKKLSVKIVNNESK